MGCTSSQIGPQKTPQEMSYELEGRMRRLKDHINNSKSQKKAQQLSILESHKKKFDSAKLTGDKKSTQENLKLYNSLGNDLDDLEKEVFGNLFNQQYSFQLIQQINKVRCDPRSLISEIKNDLTKFQQDGKVLFLNNKHIQTIEGKKAWEEAITFLQKAAAVPALKYSTFLSRGCFDHCRDMTANNFLSHQSSNKLSSSQRTKKYLPFSGSLGQIICEGAENVRQIVKMMTVNDGNPKRLDRDIIFSSKYKWGGGATLGQISCLSLIQNQIDIM